MLTRRTCTVVNQIEKKFGVCSSNGQRAHISRVFGVPGQHTHAQVLCFLENCGWNLDVALMLECRRTWRLMRMLVRADRATGAGFCGHFVLLTHNLFEIVL